jgi:hypothetical protein
MTGKSPAQKQSEPMTRYAALSPPNDQTQQPSDASSTNRHWLFRVLRISSFPRLTESYSLASASNRCEGEEEVKLLSMRRISGFDSIPSIADERESQHLERENLTRKPSEDSLFKTLKTKSLDKDMPETTRIEKKLSLKNILSVTTDAVEKQRIESELSEIDASFNNEVKLTGLYSRTLDKKRKTFNREMVLHCLDRLTAKVKAHQLANADVVIAEGASNSQIEKVFGELKNIYKELGRNVAIALDKEELKKLKGSLNEIVREFNADLPEGMNRNKKVIEAFLEETDVLLKGFMKIEVSGVASGIKALLEDEKEIEKIKAKFPSVQEKTKKLMEGSGIFEIGVADEKGSNRNHFSREGVVNLLDRLEARLLIEKLTHSSPRTSEFQPKTLKKIKDLIAYLIEGDQQSSLLDFKELARLAVEFKHLYKSHPDNEMRILLKSLHLEFMAGWSYVAHNEAYKQLVTEYDYLSKIGSEKSSYVHVGVSGGFNIDAAKAEIGVGVNKANILALDEQGLTFHANEKTSEANTSVGFGTGYSSKIALVLRWMRAKIGLSLTGSIPKKIVIKLPGIKKAIYKKSLINSKLDVVSRFTERKDMASEIYHDAYKDFANRFYYWFSPEATLGKLKRYILLGDSSVIHHESHVQRAINNKQNLREQLDCVLNIVDTDKQDEFKSALATELNLTFADPSPIHGETGKESVILPNICSDYEQPLHAVYKKLSGTLTGGLSLISGAYKFTNYDAQQVMFEDAWQKISSQYGAIEKLSGNASGIADRLMMPKPKFKTLESERQQSAQEGYIVAKQILDQLKHYFLLLDDFNNSSINEKKDLELEDAIKKVERDWCASYNYDLLEALTDEHGEVNHPSPDLKMVVEDVKRKLNNGLGGVEHASNTVKTMMMAYKINIDALRESDLSDPEFRMLEMECDAVLESRKEKMPKMLFNTLSAFLLDIESTQTTLTSLASSSPFDKSTLDTHQYMKAMEYVQDRLEACNSEEKNIENIYQVLVGLNQTFENYVNLVKQRDSGDHAKKIQLDINRIQAEFLSGKSSSLKKELSNRQVADTIASMVFVNAELGLRLLKSYEDDPLLNQHPVYLEAKAQVGKNATRIQNPNVGIDSKYFQLKSRYALIGSATIRDKEGSVKIEDPSGMVSGKGSLKFRVRPEHPNLMRQGELLSVNLALNLAPGLSAGLSVSDLIGKVIRSNANSLDKGIADLTEGSAVDNGFESAVNSALADMNSWMDVGFEGSGILNFESIKPGLYEEEAFKLGRKKAVDNAREKGLIHGDSEDLYAQHAEPKREWAYYRIKAAVGGSLTAKAPVVVSPVIKAGGSIVKVMREKLYAHSLSYVVRDLVHAISHYKGKEQVDQINKRINNNFDDYLDIFKAMHQPDCVVSKPLFKAFKPSYSEIWYELWGYLNLIKTELLSDFMVKLKCELDRELESSALSGLLLNKLTSEKDVDVLFEDVEKWLGDNCPKELTPALNCSLITTIESIKDCKKLQDQFNAFWNAPFEKEKATDVDRAKGLLIDLARLVRPILSKKAMTFLSPIAENEFPMTHSDVDSQMDPSSIPRIHYKENELRV